MIKTYQTDVNGESGARCEIDGSRLEIYNDFRVIISICCENMELLELLGMALADMDPKWKKAVEELGNDKNNTRN